MFVLFASQGEIFVTCDNADKKMDIKLNLIFFIIDDIKAEVKKNIRNLI